MFEGCFELRLGSAGAVLVDFPGVAQPLAEGEDQLAMNILFWHGFRLLEDIQCFGDFPDKPQQLLGPAFAAHILQGQIIAEHLVVETDLPGFEVLGRDNL